MSEKCLIIIDSENNLWKKFFGILKFWSTRLNLSKECLRIYINPCVCQEIKIKYQIWIFVLQLHLWSVQYVAKVMIGKLLNNTYTGNIQEKDCF